MIVVKLTPEQRRGFLLALQHAIPTLKSSEAQAWLSELECALASAPILPDKPKPQEFGPGAGWGKNPHPNDDIHRQISTDTLRPQVPVRLANAPAASEPGKMDMDLPRMPK